MTPTSLIVLAAVYGLLCLALQAVAARIAYTRGLKRGRELGWADRYFEEIENEKRRRDRIAKDRAGRFAARPQASIPVSRPHA